MNKHIVYALSFVAACSLSSNVLAYGNDSYTAPSTTNPPVCNAEKPDAPILLDPNSPATPKGRNASEVTLLWHSANKATKYLVQYGLSPRNYIFGIPDVGNSTSVTIGALQPGQTYCFAVRSVNNCMPGDLSQEWCVRAGGRTVSFGRFPRAAAFAAGTTIETETVVATPTPTVGEQMGDTVMVTSPTPSGEAQPIVVVEKQDNFFVWLWKSIQHVFGVK